MYEHKDMARDSKNALSQRKHRKEKHFIVKVQLPIVSTDPDVGVLVYNEDRSIMAELPMRSIKEAEILIQVLEDFPKGYFWAKLDDKGGIILVDEAPWQEW